MNRFLSLLLLFCLLVSCRKEEELTGPARTRALLAGRWQPVLSTEDNYRPQETTPYLSRRYWYQPDDHIIYSSRAISGNISSIGIIQKTYELVEEGAYREVDVFTQREQLVRIINLNAANLVLRYEEIFSNGNRQVREEAYIR